LEISRLEEGLLIMLHLLVIMAIIAKFQEELLLMLNRLVETGRNYGMEISIDKSQVMRVSRSNELLWIKVAIEK